MKYHHDVGLGERLARPLIKLTSAWGIEIDLVIPVPLDRPRQAERGYNQASMLARPLALALEAPYRPQALHRRRVTGSQVGLTLEERKANVEGAFHAEPRWASGKRILLVDDVMTTGATLDSCAQALHSAGARQVFGVTLARATMDSRRF